jgi:hypothetical protein
MGFEVVDILLIKILFGDEGICVKNAQSIEGQAEELCQLSLCKQGIAILHDIVNRDAIVLILRRLCQCYNNATLDCWLRKIASKVDLVFRYRPSPVTHRLRELSKSFAVVG